MLKAFEIAGYGPEVVEDKFGGMLNAFRYGAPPHGGIAPGIDRIVMLLAGVESYPRGHRLPPEPAGPGPDDERPLRSERAPAEGTLHPPRPFREGMTARPLIAAIAAISVIAAAAPASAGASPADVRCLVSAVSMMQSTDQGQKTIGLMASLYFIGKAYGAPDHEDFKAVMETEARRMTAADIAAELKRCGDELNRNGAEVQAVGRSLATPPLPTTPPS